MVVCMVIESVSILERALIVPDRKLEKRRDVPNPHLVVSVWGVFPIEFFKINFHFISKLIKIFGVVVPTSVC